MQLECNGMQHTDVVFQTLAGEMEYDYSSFGGRLKNTEANGSLVCKCRFTSLCKWRYRYNCL